ncbi:MAG: hypothetical protein KC457_33685, partial [Myxococcales bacterium]|nr:hypothetical protein [Myxococcales bacterium]
MTEPVAAPAGPPAVKREYSKDYWDQVFEQLGRHRTFQVAIAVLALMYASAIYAPLIANDRPYVLEAANYEEYGQAHRTLYPVTLGIGRLAKMDAEAYLAQRTASSTQTFDEALEAELGGALQRVETLRAYLPEDRYEQLDAFEAEARA